MTARYAIAAAARTVGVRIRDVTSRTRHPRHCEARGLAAALLAEAGWSTAQIGEALGGRDHSTIVELLKPWRAS